MANVIKHKRGSGSDPVASDLVVGEVAIRTDVGKLFTKMDNGSVAEIAGGGSDIAINTLSSSSGTGGGSATFNGSAYRFTLSAPPSVSAQQLLVSINGVIQKPVAGTGQPSEGFSVDGTDIILGDAPATGSDFFILTFKSLGVSEPADNSVTSAKIVDGAIVNADINASASIQGTKISPNFGSQNIVTTGEIKSHTLFESASGNDLRLNAGSANRDIFFQVNDSTLTTVQGSTGRVGIGTTSPRRHFHIHESASATVGFQMTNGNTGESNDSQGFQLKVGSDSHAEISQMENSHLAIFTNASERMRIDSSGDVAIGSTTNGGANRLLIVNNESGDFVNGSDAALRITNSNASNDTRQASIAFTVSTTGVGSDGAIVCTSESAGNSNLRFFTDQGNGLGEKMRIASDGKVGIGTTSPSELLQVAGTLECNNIKFLTANKFETSANVFEGKGTNGARLRSALSAAGTPSFSSSDDTDSGMFLPGSNVLGFTTGGSERLRIDSSGQVGIGTTSPARLLHQHVSSSSANYHLFTNDTTGSSSTDGLLIGINQNEDSFVWNYENTNLRIGTNNTERMRIDSSGNVGIGETSIETLLHIKGTDTAYGGGLASGAIFQGEDAQGRKVQLVAPGALAPAGVGTPTNHTFTIFTGNTERIRVDTSGNVGIGTGTPSELLQVAGTLECNNIKFLTANKFETSTNVLEGKGVNGARLRSALSAASTPSFSNSDDPDSGMFLPGSNVLGLSTGGSERLRIDSSGNVGIGVTNPSHSIHCVNSSDVAKFDHTGTGNTIGIVMRHGRGGLSGFNGKMISFIGNDNSEEGSINIHTTSTAYNTSSDYRLKENEVAITDGVTRLKTLKPYKFNFKKDPSVKVDGFFAHEVSSVVPIAVTGEKDETNEDGSIKPQGIDHSKLVPLLVAALQEAIGRIEVLEAK